MIDWVIGFSIRNKHLVFFAVALGCAWGIWSMLHMPVDAMPDVGDTQVIVLSRWDRSPDIIEDQVTNPIVTALAGAPRVRTVRGVSDFGSSFVYVVFEDGTDPYWARSRTLEYLSAVSARMPEGVKTELGPDASGLGWVLQYVLVDDSGQHSLAELRSYQDWYLKPYLKLIQGVAEVATVGGFVNQFQVNVDPNRLLSYGIPLSSVTAAVRAANQETGARLLEMGGAEYMIRGHGYVRSTEDLEQAPIGSRDGAPIRIRDVGQVTRGPDIRRGVSDFDGRGDVVSGIIVMRDGSNALDVATAVKARLLALQASMPKGVRAIPVYDRSDLIQRAISNSRRTLISVVITVSIVILVFLWHPPSAIIPLLTIPVAVVLTFIPLQMLGVSINILSLAGIALACGEFVDAAIVVVEQTYKKLEANPRIGGMDHHDVVISAIREVAGPTFFALLVIAVSFVPVMVLGGQAGKLFRPLVFAKSFGLLIAAVLALTLDPALRLLLVRSPAASWTGRTNWSRFLRGFVGGKIRSEASHPITGPLMRLYEPIVRWTVRHNWLVIACACGIVLLTFPAAVHLKTELMPAIEEGSLLYMPSTAPGISIAESQRLLETTDRIIRRFPEVDHVLGKAGRAETATDPAPLSMLETVIVLKPESQWRKRRVWYSSWAPQWLVPTLRHITSDHISEEHLVAEMNAALDVPGLSNSWTMPIRGRIEMLSTGIRTPVGLKVQGPDLARVQEIGTQIERLLQGVPGTRGAFAERTAQGYFLDVNWNRFALAQYGLSIEDAQSALATAVGGENVSTIIDGRARYPVDVRYMRDFRSNVDAINKVLVPVSGDKQIPVSDLAEVRFAEGPAMVRDEDGLLTGYVFVDTAASNTADYVSHAKRVLAGKIPLPPGYLISWSGQYEATQQTNRRLAIAVPVTIILVLFLLYLNTRSVAKMLIVALAVPFSAVGAVWLVSLLGYNMSVAVWVGIIALMGVDAETGVFMLLYLDLAFENYRRTHGRLTPSLLIDSIVEGAAKRVRPKFMTFATVTIGLAPVLWSNGAGSAIFKRIAAPMLGGAITSFLLELLVYPAVYCVWRSASLRLDADALPSSETAAAHRELLPMGG